MEVTIVGTGNMARGIGSRVLAGGHDLTVVGKDRERAEGVASDTTFANALSSGEVSGQPLDVLIAGDDSAAKGAVAALARDGGLNPIDAGPQARGRELEALGLLHITLQDQLGTGFASAVKPIA